jgi:murein L,D-transpeptidase YcbB/YkuD
VLRQRIAALASTADPQIDGAPIAALHGMTKLYERRGYRPVWTDSAMVVQLRDQVKLSVEHGLNPEDFHLSQLNTRIDPRSRSEDPAFQADTDILCTDAFVRLSITLRYGKLDAANLDPAWNFDRSIDGQDVVLRYNEVLSLGDIANTLRTVAPNLDHYDRLRQALMAYSDIEARGGWPQVPDGGPLKLGSTGTRVAALSNRLLATGDLEASDSADLTRFDEALEAAVVSFQARHGIDADGTVGPRSTEALNVPVEDRIDQIRANLERVRWVFRNIEDTYIIVDIAGYDLRLIERGKETWRTQVQVGKPYHATPVFRSRVQYLVLNPTWTVPPGIKRKETLPAIRKDVNYLSNNNMSVVAHDGQIVDPTTIDWAATDKGLPYNIRQEPGTHNALGQVKFIFPNPYMVYLHDTPSKGLFSRTERAFSHGCIRTQNPLDLAVHLLDDQGWDRARIDSVIASGKTTRVNLTEPIPVMLLYWTAQVSDDGTVQFRKDLYGRDVQIIDGLNQPFRTDPPTGVREAVDKP